MLNALVTLAAEEHETPNPLLPAWYDIIWSSVCFIVILFIFWKVALPRLKKLLDERATAIEGNIAKADEAQRRAEAALEEYTAQLAGARKEAGEIRDAAREDGTLAIDLAGGVIGESLADDRKAQGVVDRFLAELEASETASPGPRA
jgi:F-type H+-transporting ATPase subunit b